MKIDVLADADSVVQAAAAIVAAEARAAFAACGRFSAAISGGDIQRHLGQTTPLIHQFPHRY